jgi:hypothetical protein
MWHCELCYNVFHFRCIKTWSESNPVNTFYRLSRLFPWTCPFYSVGYLDPPRATCWCGKLPSSDGVNHNGVSQRPMMLNACPYLCVKIHKCRHNRDTQPCLKTCHLGPCNQPCMDNCSDLPEITPQKPTGWARLCRRVRERSIGPIRTLVLSSSGMALVHACILVFAIKHIGWWSQPWRYHYFTEVSGKYENPVIIFIWLLIFLPLQLLLLNTWISSLDSIFVNFSNLGDTRTRGKLKAWTKRAGLVVLGLVAVVAILGQFIA